MKVDLDLFELFSFLSCLVFKQFLSLELYMITSHQVVSQSQKNTHPPPKFIGRSKRVPCSLKVLTFSRHLPTLTPRLQPLGKQTDKLTNSLPHTCNSSAQQCCSDGSSKKAELFVCRWPCHHSCYALKLRFGAVSPLMLTSEGACVDIHYCNVCLASFVSFPLCDWLASFANGCFHSLQC